MLISKVIKPFSRIKLPMAKSNFCTASTMHVKKTFENAISALNNLQSNASAVNLSLKLRQQQIHDEANLNLRDTEKFLERIDGFNMKSLDRLSIIHVSGSKGKGSVCTYTDAILREYNVKTGLFTSPHLISVTERIKLMGISIDKSDFNRYFWEVYDALQSKKSHENDLPSYFKFLQIMAFYIFVKEEVDVAIVEVGIGGEYDSTNILRNTEIVGITALQLEHTQLLGKTLEEIAWQKAGIIKKDSFVYYMKQSKDSVANVIEERFKELKGKRLSPVPFFDEYVWHNCSLPDFKQTSDINKINFSLAAQLSARWLKNRMLLSERYFSDNVLIVIESKFIDAIQKCQVEGRFQQIKSAGINFYLDGAHTIDSMFITSNWFSSKIENEKTLSILLFNVTGDRDSEHILNSLHSIPFDFVCFTTNIASEETNKQCENYTDIHQNVQYDRCLKHKEIWTTMNADKRLKSSDIECFKTIQDALDYICNIKDNNLMPINVLITGSLHLVGGSLKIIKSIENIDMINEKFTERNMT
ncbi:unnamed protein product [Chironomus riparius]|uniref:tetrahydrofolate synthase n=1 Tax=Chironomus riparius TaxID=315576 RepID=A0A9N9WPK4_9DIPT|nr:unnamed protein product [Chironomus riparius]